VNRTSFNGPGGINARPRPEERVAMNEHHIQPTAQQQSHQQVAHREYTSVNHGRPATTTMNKVGNNANGMHHGGFSNHANPAITQHQQMRAYPRMQSPQGRRSMGGNGQHHERRI
jgi:hypothetical protein